MGQVPHLRAPLLLCTELDREFLEDRDLLPGISPVRGWSCEFLKCPLYTRMNYQGGESLLLTGVVDAGQRTVFYIPERLILPRTRFSAVAQFLTRILPRGLWLFSSSKASFHLSLRLLHLSTFCCSGLRGHSHCCGPDVICEMNT